MTIVEFLLDRIAEDEAGEQTWVSDVSAVGEHLGYTPGMKFPPTPRMVAECAAKREIIRLHHDFDTKYWHDDPSCSGMYGDDESSEDCQTLAALAAVYADHPDYREEWNL